MSVLRWEAPGPVMGKWQSVVADLQANPGEWAVIDEGAPDRDVRSARNSLKRFGVQVQTRNVDGQGSTIYARWPH